MFVKFNLHDNEFIADVCGKKKTVQFGSSMCMTKIRVNQCAGCRTKSPVLFLGEFQQFDSASAVDSQRYL